MALRFKFKARPESRRPRFGGSGSPSKRTRGGSMARLKKKKEEPKETQSLSRGGKAAASIASKIGADVMGAVEDVKKQMAAGMKEDDKKKVAKKKVAKKKVASNKGSLTGSTVRNPLFGIPKY